MKCVFVAIYLFWEQMISCGTRKCRYVCDYCCCFFGFCTKLTKINIKTLSFLLIFLLTIRGRRIPFYICIDTYAYTRSHFDKRNTFSFCWRRKKLFTIKLFSFYLFGCLFALVLCLCLHSFTPFSQNVIQYKRWATLIQFKWFTQLIVQQFTISIYIQH